MRTPVLMLLGIGTIVAAAPARAQTYDPSYPVCMNLCKRGAARSIVATHRWRNAMHRRQAAGLGASSIPILARECLRDEIIAVSIKIVSRPSTEIEGFRRSRSWPFEPSGAAFPPSPIGAIIGHARPHPSPRS